MIYYKRFRLFGSVEFTKDATCTKDLYSLSEESIETIVGRGKIFFLVNGILCVVQYDKGCGPFTVFPNLCLKLCWQGEAYPL